MYMDLEQARALRLRVLEEGAEISTVYVASDDDDIRRWCVIIVPKDVTLEDAWIWSPEEYDAELPFVAVGE